MNEANSQSANNEARSLAELGAVLRGLRESKNLTIDDVSAETFIRQKFLEGIENGDFSNFKALVYARGFAHSYANFLGAPELWDEYRLQLTLDNFQPLAEEEDEESNYSSRSSHVSMLPPSSARAGVGVSPTARGFRQSPMRRNCIVSLLVILVLCGIVLMLNWDTIQSEIASVQSRQVYDTVKSREAEKAKHDEQVKAEEEAVAREVSQQTAKVENPAPPAPKPEPEPEPVKKAELTIRATGECWMRVTCEGEKLFEGVVTKGWERTFPLDKDLSARYGRGQYIMMSTNGKDFSNAGTGVQRYTYAADGTIQKENSRSKREVRR